MTDVFTDLDAAEWLALFEGVQRSWFRLETLQVYAVGHEDTPQREYLLTGRIDTTPGPWQRMIARHAAAGRELQRVHVVEEPLTDYLRYELAAYAVNAAAGEDIRLVSVPAGSWPDRLPRATDFWLFEDEDVWDMEYDDEGRFTRAVRSHYPDHLHQCRRWRDAALAQSTALETYTVATA